MSGDQRMRNRHADSTVKKSGVRFGKHLGKYFLHLFIGGGGVDDGTYFCGAAKSRKVKGDLLSCLVDGAGLSLFLYREAKL